MERCPLCGEVGIVYHVETYRMAEGAVETFFHSCPNGHNWTFCPWCGAIAQRDSRTLLSSTDPLGVTATEKWRCVLLSEHHWTVALSPDALTPDDLFGDTNE